MLAESSLFVHRRHCMYSSVTYAVELIIFVSYLLQKCRSHKMGWYISEEARLCGCCGGIWSATYSNLERTFQMLHDFYFLISSALDYWLPFSVRFFYLFSHSSFEHVGFKYFREFACVWRNSFLAKATINWTIPFLDFSSETS